MKKIKAHEKMLNFIRPQGNASLNHMRFYFTFSRKIRMKKKKIITRDTGDYNKELKTRLKLVTSIDESTTLTLCLYFYL